MALHDKHHHVTTLRPDIAIIQECADPDTLRRKAPDFAFSDVAWIGPYKNKGLGVFAFGVYRLQRHAAWSADHAFFLPLDVSGPHAVQLLAVWAFADAAGTKVTPNPPALGAAVSHYREFLSSPDAVLAGDLNSSVTFDKPRSRGRFADVDARLRDYGLTSAYHHTSGEALGAEQSPTFHFRRRVTEPFHIDYVYAAPGTIGSVSVGGAGEWLGRSDHMPVMVELGDSSEL